MIGSTVTLSYIIFTRILFTTILTIFTRIFSNNIYEILHYEFSSHIKKSAAAEMPMEGRRCRGGNGAIGHTAVLDSDPRVEMLDPSPHLACGTAGGWQHHGRRRLHQRESRQLIPTDPREVRRSAVAAAIDARRSLLCAPRPPSEQDGPCRRRGASWAWIESRRRRTTSTRGRGARWRSSRGRPWGRNSAAADEVVDPNESRPAASSPCGVWTCPETTRQAS